MLEFENTSQSLCSFNKTWIGSQRKRLIGLSVEVPIWFLHRQVSHYHKTNYSDIEALLVLFSYWLWFTLFWYWQIACAVCDCQRLTLSWYWCIVCFVSFDDCPWFTSIYPDCHINVAYTDLPDQSFILSSQVSEHILVSYLDICEDIQWDAMRYLIANINYGGHVTDQWDKRLLMTYVSDYFCESVFTVPFFK